MKHLYGNIVFYFFLFYFCTDLFPQAEGIKFDHISLESGISSNVVKCIIQDRRGFMWFGTKKGGLNKYDGYKFTLYTSNKNDSNSLSDDNINVLFQSFDQTIWVGTTNHGVNSINPYTDKITKYNSIEDDTNTLTDDIIVSICEDEENNIWVATLYGLNKIDPETHKVKQYLSSSSSNSIASNKITQLVKDKNGKIWIGYSFQNLITQFDPENNSFKHFKIDPTSNNSTSVVSLIYDDNYIWILTSNSIYRLDLKTNTTSLIKKDSQLKKSYIQAIKDKKGDIWIASSNALIRYISSADLFMEYLNDPMDINCISSNTILSIYEDNGGIIWLGTSEGLDKIDPEVNKFKLIRQTSKSESSISGNVIKSIYQDHQNNIWIGSMGGGLNKLNRRKQTVTHYKYEKDNPYSLSSDYINKIIPSKDGNLWIATDKGGLNKFDLENNIFIKYFYNPSNFNSISSDNVNDIIEDNEGFLWIATEKGVDRFDPITQTFTRYNEFGAVIVIKLYNNKLIIGSKQNGLFFLNKKTGEFELISNQANYIKDIYIDFEDNIWIGYLGGLDFYNPKKEEYKKIESIGNVKTFSIVSITQDNTGNLWLGSKSNGLLKFDPGTHYSTVYDYQSGIGNIRFTDHSAYRNQKGELFFGTIDGLIYFQPTEIKRNSSIYPLVLTDFQLFNKSVKPTESKELKYNISYSNNIVLSYKQKIITLEFALLNFSKPDLNLYSYILENFDKEWTPPSNQRKATYTNLKPGKYIFRVKGISENGIWNDKGVYLNITILPPYWQTWWFISIIVIIFISIIFSIYHIRMRRIKRHEIELEKQVKERTSEVIKQKEELEIRQKEIINQQYVIEEKNKDITDSILYARKIQMSILPPIDMITKLLPNSFIYYKPRDIVSGDFYWIETVPKEIIFDFENTSNNDIFFASVDCTGHGVPGAFMSIMGYMLLNQSIKEQRLIHPYEILNYLNVEVKRVLRRYDEGSRDGMDIALCKLDLENMKLEYAGARIDLYLVRDEKMIVYKADDFSIGSYLAEKPQFFKNNEIDLKKGDCLYIFSDGYFDQIGGPKNKRFSKNRISETLLVMGELPMKKQEEILEDQFLEWKGENDQMDDIIILGVKI